MLKKEKRMKSLLLQIMAQILNLKMPNLGNKKKSLTPCIKNSKKVITKDLKRKNLQSRNNLKKSSKWTKIWSNNLMNSKETTKRKLCSHFLLLRSTRKSKAHLILNIKMISS